MARAGRKHDHVPAPTATNSPPGPPSINSARPRRHGQRLVHLAMDTATSDIHAVDTPSREGDSPVLPELLDRIPEQEPIGTVTADGAYDTRRCHTAIGERQATAIISICRNGRPWKQDCPAA